MGNDSTLRRRFTSAIASVAVLFCLAVPAAIGAPITYVFSGPATGTLGVTPFTGAQVTITATADTVNVTTYGGFATIPCINLTSLTINITGVGSTTTTGQNFLFDNQTVPDWGLNGGAGAACNNPGSDWVDVTNGQAATYGLVTAIGPTTGTPAALENPIATTAGALLFTSAPPTFQAMFAAASPNVAIPTLSKWALILLGLALTGMAVFSLRRRTPRVEPSACCESDLTV